MKQFRCHGTGVRRHIRTPVYTFTITFVANNSKPHLKARAKATRINGRKKRRLIKPLAKNVESRDTRGRRESAASVGRTFQRAARLQGDRGESRESHSGGETLSEIRYGNTRGDRSRSRVRTHLGVVVYTHTRV